MPLLLLPYPGVLKEGERAYATPSGISLDVSTCSSAFAEAAEVAAAIMGSVSNVAINPDAKWRLEVWQDASLLESGSEAYMLDIGPSGGKVTASTGAGVHRALATLTQLLIQAEGELREVHIEDAPRLGVRSYMLDISRDRVAARRTLLHILDVLWLCKYNELQLYVEHTFAFPGHEEVWKDASPLCSEDIAWLENQCEARGIELVPNMNSLGHYGRWLKHPSYRKYSECPGGCTLPNGRVMPVGGTTLVPGEDTLKFLSSLYDSYLPLFKSGKFNAGLDEPWELGLGRSADECARIGKQSLYLGHLKAVAKLASSYGKKLQFWADIVLESPARVPELPDGVTGMIWGYEAGHPFREQCEAFEKAGVPFVVCPGTTGWNSFAGRWINARSNIAEAVYSAQHSGGLGVTLTDWGDNGHHQPPPVSLAPLLLCAELSWSGLSHGPEEVANAGMDEKIIRALNTFILRDDTGNSGKVLVALASACERFFSVRIHNCAPAWKMLLAPKNELADLLDETDGAKVDAFIEELHSLDGLIEESRPGGFGAHGLVREELRLARDLLLAGAMRYKGALDEEWYGQLCERFEELWLQRSERGGLADSVRRLREFSIEP